MVSPASPIQILASRVVRVSLLAALFMIMAGIGAYLTLTLLFDAAEPVVVPDLVGKEVLVSLEILSDLGLNTRVKGTAYHDHLPKNHVIDQDPEPGAAIKQGRDVKIRVSRGSEHVVMPNLIGISLQQGQILLTENGLCRGAVSHLSRLREAVDQVIAQYPASGKTVPRNSCVDLLVSRGPVAPTFAMPDLSGFSLERAIRHLEQQRLTLGSIHTTHTVTAPLEVIVGQVPLPGHPTAPGNRVDLTVNRPATARRPGDPLAPNPVALFRFSLEYGFLNQRVQVSMNRPGLSIRLLDQFFSPGQEIWLLVPKSGNPTVLVYVDGRLVESRIMDGD